MGEATTCGEKKNHFGSPWVVVADVERSCDCEQECTASPSCKAWTHDGSRTCYLRQSKHGGFTLGHHDYGMTSGEKNSPQPTPSPPYWYPCCNQHESGPCIDCGGPFINPQEEIRVSKRPS